MADYWDWYNQAFGDPLTPSNGPVIATFPTTGIGAPPATRPVQSVPVGTQQGSDPVGKMPTLAEVQAALGRPLTQGDIAALYANVFPTDTAKQLQSTGAKGGGGDGSGNASGHH